MPITALYASILTLLFVVLSIRVIGARHASKTALGDGGNPDVLRRIRVQGNFAEYVPLALLLIALAESMKASIWLLHLLGILLLIGRIFHAYGMSQTNERFVFRTSGMVLTFAAIIGGALLCLLKAASGIL